RKVQGYIPGCYFLKIILSLLQDPVFYGRQFLGVQVWIPCGVWKGEKIIEIMIFPSRHHVYLAYIKKFPEGLLNRFRHIGIVKQAGWLAIATLLEGLIDLFSKNSAYLVIYIKLGITGEFYFIYPLDHIPGEHGRDLGFNDVIEVGDLMFSSFQIELQNAPGLFHRNIDHSPYLLVFNGDEEVKGVVLEEKVFSNFKIDQGRMDKFLHLFKDLFCYFQVFRSEFLPADKVYSLLLQFRNNLFPVNFTKMLLLQSYLAEDLF